MKGDGNMKHYKVNGWKKDVGVFMRVGGKYYAFADDWRNRQVERRIFKDSDGHYFILDSVKQYIYFPADESEFESYYTGYCNKDNQPIEHCTWRP